MKITKILVLSLVLCLALTSLTAFADINVTTVTSYDYYAAGTDLMEVTATVSGVAVGDMITYYVSDGSNIIYIDQKTADATSFNFQFEATKDAVIGATAKNGSNKGYKFDQFTFAEGSNYLANGDADANLVEYKLASDLGIVDDEVEEGAYAFTCTLNGNATEYGVKLGNDELQAYGCLPGVDNATYVVVINGITAEDAAKVEAYAR